MKILLFCHENFIRLQLELILKSYLKQLGSNLAIWNWALLIFHAVENDDNVQAAEDKAEPVMKKSRLENYFKQLFGPNFESRRKEAYSTPAA